MRRINPMWILAMGAALLMLSWSFGQRQLRNGLERLKRLDRQAEELRELKQRILLGKEVLDQDVTRSADAIEDMIDAYAADSGIRVEGNTEEELAPGIRRQVARLQLAAVSPDALRNFLEEAEKRNPPWRVISLDLRSELGRIQGELQLECIDRPD